MNAPCDTDFRAKRHHLVIVVAATALVQAAAAWAVLALAAMAPEMGRALDIPPSLIGIQIAIVYAGAMVTSLVGGALVRRLGAARTSQMAMMAVVAGCALALMPSLTAIALASVLIGLGYGMTNPPSSHLLIRASAPSNRNLIFSIKQTGVPLGGMIAGLTAPVLALEFGWQAAMVAVALAACLLAASLQPARAGWDSDRDHRAPWGENPLRGLGLIWHRRDLRYLSLTGFAFAFVQLCLTTFLVTLLVADTGIDLVEAGIMLSLVQVSGVIGRLLWGVVADWLKNGIATLIGLGAVMALGAMAVTLFSPDWPRFGIIAVLLVFGLTASGWNGIYLAELARRVPPSEISRATGASLFFTYGGVLVGPPFFTLVHSQIGFYTLTHVTTALAALFGIAMLVLARREV